MVFHVGDVEVEVDSAEVMATIVEGGHLERGETGVAEEDMEDLLVVEEEDLDNRSVWLCLCLCLHEERKNVTYNKYYNKTKLSIFQMCLVRTITKVSRQKILD